VSGFPGYNQDFWGYTSTFNLQDNKLTTLPARFYEAVRPGNVQLWNNPLSSLPSNLLGACLWLNRYNGYEFNFQEYKLTDLAPDLLGDCANPISLNIDTQGGVNRVRRPVASAAPPPFPASSSVHSSFASLPPPPSSFPL
jgi:hypothetical protein